MRENSKKVKELVFETAAVDLGISQSLVEEVFQAQVKFTSRKIGEGGFETVMWPKFGKFRPKMKDYYIVQREKATKEIRQATKKVL